MRIVVSPAAEADIEEIWLTIAADNPAAANRVVRGIGRKIRLLEQNPRLGVRRPDIAPTLRMLVERPYLVLYELQPDHDESAVAIVEIVRVIDGRRDLATLF
jgi:toxin ParE1/3/4